MLDIHHLTAGYSANTVLHDVSLRVERGEIVAVLGANGAGKSTLMRAIVGLLRPGNVRGEILLEGKRLNGKAPEDILLEGVALVPEGRRIFSALTVEENLRAGGYALSAADLNAEMDTVFSLFPVLAVRRNGLGGTLSGGQQQMLAIGRALMSRPRLLLLDEPSLGLAPLLVASILNMITDLRTRGVTIMLVEQNVQKALEIADRAYVLANGAVRLEGTAADLRARGKDVTGLYMGIGEIKS